MVKAILCGVLVFLSECSLSLADDLRNCQEQRDDIVYEMGQAKRYGNVHKQRGLETALSRVERYCQDDEPDPRVDQLSRAHTDVRRREDQLEVAIDSGSSRMVEKYKKKLAQARARLRDLSDK
ncbi:DUF1090 family protein [Pseudomonas shirazensis]|uniref:DUF1090 family protein n=1 Tax=Pseudomonas shirazensis TaxID=2745494 RepID=UPI003D2BEE31